MEIYDKDYDKVLKMASAVSKETAIAFMSNILYATENGITLMASIDAQGAPIAVPAGSLKKNLFKRESLSLDTLPFKAPDEPPVFNDVKNIGSFAADDFLRLLYLLKKAKNFPVFIEGGENKLVCSCIYSPSQYGILSVDGVMTENISFSMDKGLAAPLIKAFGKIGGNRCALLNGSNFIGVKLDEITMLFNSAGEPPAVKDWSKLPEPDETVYSIPNMELKKKYTIIEGNTVVDVDDATNNCYLSTSMRGIKNLISEDESVRYAETNTLGYFFSEDLSACFVCGKFKQ